MRLGEEIHDLGGGTRGLGHRVRDILGILACPCQEDAGSEDLDRPELGMRLREPDGPDPWTSPAFGPSPWRLPAAPWRWPAPPCPPRPPRASPAACPPPSPPGGHPASRSGTPGRARRWRRTAPRPAARTPRSPCRSPGCPCRRCRPWRLAPSPSGAGRASPCTCSRPWSSTGDRAPGPATPRRRRRPPSWAPSRRTAGGPSRPSVPRRSRAVRTAGRR